MQNQIRRISIKRSCNFLATNWTNFEGNRILFSFILKYIDEVRNTYRRQLISQLLELIGIIMKIIAIIIIRKRNCRSIVVLAGKKFKSISVRMFEMFSLPMMEKQSIIFWVPKHILIIAIQRHQKVKCWMSNGRTFIILRI